MQQLSRRPNVALFPYMYSSSLLHRSGEVFSTCIHWLAICRPKRLKVISEHHFIPSIIATMSSEPGVDDYLAFNDRVVVNLLRQFGKSKANRKWGSSVKIFVQFLINSSPCTPEDDGVSSVFSKKSNLSSFLEIPLKRVLVVNHLRSAGITWSPDCEWWTSSAAL